jgi:hypothetical protein
MMDGQQNVKNGPNCTVSRSDAAVEGDVAMRNLDYVFSELSR